MLAALLKHHGHSAQAWASSLSSSILLLLVELCCAEAWDAEALQVWQQRDRSKLVTIEAEVASTLLVAAVSAGDWDCGECSVAEVMS